MITFRPIDAILFEIQAGHYAHGVRFYHAEEWLMIFAHYVSAYRQPGSTYGWPWAIFNRTSAIGQTELEPFGCRDAGREASGRLADLFQHAGLDTHAGLFLWRMGIREHADLFTPVTIPGRKPDWPLAWWHNQVARWFKKPGPNPSHPEARWVDRVRLVYSNYYLRWAVSFYYAYEHEGPCSWNSSVIQKPRETLDAFGKRVSEYIETAFEPEDLNGPLHRPHVERHWHTIRDALDAIFPWGGKVPPDFENQIADILAERGQFSMNASRLATLKRWARADAKAHAKDEKAA